MKMLVVIPRSLHLGYVGAFGNPWINTPTLDRLAAEGVVFDQHFADHPDAAGAQRSWRTGRYSLPSSLPKTPPSDPAADLLEHLRSHNISTSLVTDGICSSSESFAAGWDTVYSVSPGSEKDPLKALFAKTAAVLKRLARQEKWLLWVDSAGLIPPWNVPEHFQTAYFDSAEESPDVEDQADESPTPWPDPPAGPIDPEDEAAFFRLQRTYAGAVHYFDASLGKFLDGLRRNQILDDLFVVVSTDHSLPLGEHGLVGANRPWLHDELIHIPLIARLPKAAEAGRRVFGLTQAVDLAPTLLDLFEIPLPAEVQGRSLRPLVHGEVDQIRSYAVAGLQVGQAMEWGLRTTEWSFLLPEVNEPDFGPRSAQLYVKPDDRWEVNDVMQHHLELADQLQQTLRAFVDAASRAGPLQAPELRDAVDGDSASET